jgi:CheY-like chemotaxis protein
MNASARTSAAVSGRNLSPPRSQGAPRHRTILIVEDEPAYAEMLRHLLESIPCRCETARNGAEAIKCILSQEFDFILCDMVMPEFPGQMFYRAIQQVRPNLCPRVIFMTGHREDHEIVQFIRSVKGRLLWKPFEFAALLEAMMAIETHEQPNRVRRPSASHRA